MKAIFLLLALVPWAGSVACQTTPIVFQHVRVFDGLQVTPSTDVLIRDGRIQDIGQDLKDPSAQIVDGTGKTLLPGLIDSHVHVHRAESLQQALIFGVTTEFDMAMPAYRISELKNPEMSSMADFWSFLSCPRAYS